MADARAFRAATRTSRPTAWTGVDGRSHTDRARGLAAPRVPAGPRFSTPPRRPRERSPIPRSARSGATSRASSSASWARWRETRCGRAR